MKRLLYIYLGFYLIGCTSEDSFNKIIIPSTENIEVGFSTSLETIKEGETKNITLYFGNTTSESGFVTLAYSSDNATYSNNFTTSPKFENGELTINFNLGIDSLVITFQALADTNAIGESVQFNIAETASTLNIGNNANININIEDSTQPAAPAEKLTVVTWNIENFPKNGATTITAIKDIILSMDADIIALQEMKSITEFNNLANAIEGWEGKIYDVRGAIELAYLYKTSEITAFSNLSIIFPDERSAFPRQPVLATATHINGLTVSLFNIHLKCCNEGEGRRENASILLKEYLDNNYATKNVIVLGDYNDDILNGSPFTNIIDDTNNYVFADMNIATASSSEWSYPSWPSHIDHILLSDELMDNFTASQSLKLDEEVTGYESNVSDHRPITATFEND